MIIWQTVGVQKLVANLFRDFAPLQNNRWNRAGAQNFAPLIDKYPVTQLLWRYVMFNISCKLPSISVHSKLEFLQKTASTRGKNLPAKPIAAFLKAVAGFLKEFAVAFVAAAFERVVASYML